MHLTLNALVQLLVGNLGGALSQFLVSAPPATTAGSSMAFTVVAADAGGHAVVGYNGTIRLDVPGTFYDYTLTNGVGVFAVTLTEAHASTITASDTVTSSIRGTSNSIACNANVVTQLTVSGPDGYTAHVPFNITIASVDAWYNFNPVYHGTVGFHTSDGSGTMPGDHTLTAGRGVFAATLVTAPPQTITAQDTTTSSIKGTWTPPVP